VLAHLPDQGEPVLLEQLDGGAEQETALRLAARGYLRDGLDAAAPDAGIAAV